MGAKKWPESLNQYFAGVDMEVSNLMLGGIKVEVQHYFQGFGTRLR
jgi:hypothetical protein